MLTDDSKQGKPSPSRKAAWAAEKRKRRLDAGLVEVHLFIDPVTLAEIDRVRDEGGHQGRAEAIAAIVGVRGS